MIYIKYVEDWNFYYYKTKEHLLDCTYTQDCGKCQRFTEQSNLIEEQLWIYESEFHLELHFEKQAFVSLDPMSTQSIGYKNWPVKLKNSSKKFKPTFKYSPLLMISFKAGQIALIKNQLVLMVDNLTLIHNIFLCSCRH